MRYYIKRIVKVQLINILEKSILLIMIFFSNYILYYINSFYAAHCKLFPLRFKVSYACSLGIPFLPSS